MKVVITNTQDLLYRHSELIIIDETKVVKLLYKLGINVFSFTKYVSTTVFEGKTSNGQYKQILCDYTGIYECLSVVSENDHFIENREYISESISLVA